MDHKWVISFDCQPWAHSSLPPSHSLTRSLAVKDLSYSSLHIPVLIIPACTSLTAPRFSLLQANNPIVSHMFRTTNIKQVIKLHKQTGFSQQQINTSPRLVFVEFDKPPTLLPPHSCYVCPQPSSSFIPTLLHPASKGRHSLLINCWNRASSLVHGIEMGMEL